MVSPEGGAVFSEPPDGVGGHSCGFVILALCFGAGATETRAEIPVDPEVPDHFLNTS